MKPLGPRGIVALVIALICLTTASFGLYLPSIPSMVRALAAEFAAVQLTLSVFLFGYGLFQLVIGPMSDSRGRRGVLIWFLALYVAASLACAFASSVGWLIAGRVLQSMGACAALVIGRAVVRDTHSAARLAQAFAYIAAAMVLVPVIAPVVGGQIDAWVGWQGNFVAMAALGIAALAAIVVFLPETNTRRDPEAAKPSRLARNYLALAADARFRGYTLVNACAFAAIFAYSSSVPMVLIDLLGVTPQMFGVLIAGPVLFYGVSAFLTARVVGRLGAVRMIEWGAIAIAASGLLMTGFALAGGATVAEVLIAATMVNFGSGLLIPNAQAQAIAPYPHMAGTAAALSGAVQMVVAALAGAATAAFYDDSALPMGLGMAATGLAGLALHLRARRRASRVRPVPPAPR
jgi:DHA1 family bicyclomycin/chloramphenicol resistance-like MFS transporter